MSSSRFGKRALAELYPVVEPNLSDSGSADCVLEFLVRAGGRSLPEVIPPKDPLTAQLNPFDNQINPDPELQ